MTKLIAYGKPSYTYEYIKSIINKNIKRAGLDVFIEEISDTNRFIEDKIESIPAFKIDSRIISKADGSNSSDLAREVSQAILKLENFGNMQKLIIPTDFSECSNNAIIYAVHLNRRIDSIVKLLHVYHPTAVVTGNAVYVDPENRSNKENQLTELTNELNKRWIGDDTGQLKIEKEFSEGFAADKIIELSKDNDNAIIVMGNTGESNDLKKIFGSVTTEVAEKCQSPVLLIPENVEFSDIKNVAYCSDDIELDENTMESLYNFIKNFDCNLHIIHYESSKPYAGYYLEEKWTSLYPGIKVKLDSIKGENVHEAINDYCRNNEIDLVAVSKKEKNFLDRLFKKSFTKEIAIYTKTPLLIIHEKK